MKAKDMVLTVFQTFEFIFNFPHYLDRQVPCVVNSVINQTGKIGTCGGS